MAVLAGDAQDGRCVGYTGKRSHNVIRIGGQAALAPAGSSAASWQTKRSRSCSNVLPGNGTANGGIKIVAKNGWFATRPLGNKAIYGVHGGSVDGNDHLQRILKEAHAIVDKAIVLS